MLTNSEARIDRTARLDTPPNTMINSSVGVRVTAAKCVARFPSASPDSGKPSKHKERWEIEADGLGNFEVDFEVSASTAAMKDLVRREAKVRALAIKAAKADLTEALNDHLG